jgi:hypothetical protein
MVERRRPTPDVLGEVLRSRPVHQPTSPPAPPDKVEKVKATFYLHPQIVKRLDALWLRLRARMKEGQLPTHSKSIVVELALELMLEDVEASEMESALVRRLLDKYTSTP